MVSACNELTALLTESNVSMHEAKTFVCELRPGRLNRLRRAVAPFAPLPDREPAIRLLDAPDPIVYAVVKHCPRHGHHRQIHDAGNAKRE